MKEVKAYKCEYCSKLYQREHFAKAHEIICKKNPENQRPCFTCSHLKKELVECEDVYYPGDSVKFNLLYCSAHKKHVYPPSVEHKGNAIDIGEYNDPMPKKCELHKDWSHPDNLPF